jgi:hypothetical protein
MQHPQIIAASTQDSRASFTEALSKVALAASMVIDVPWTESAYIVTEKRNQQHTELSITRGAAHGTTLRVHDENTDVIQTFPNIPALISHLSRALIGEAITLVQVYMMRPRAHGNIGHLSVRSFRLFSTCEAGEGMPNGQQAEVLRYWHAANTIGRGMRTARSDPAYKMTRNRLMREFDDLSGTLPVPKRY